MPSSSVSSSSQTAACHRVRKASSEDIIRVQNEIVARLQDIPCPRFVIKCEWVHEYSEQLGANWGSWVLSLINILVARNHTGPVTIINAESVAGAMNQAPQTTSVTQTAGGDQNGNTAGVGNMTEIGTIINFNNWLEEKSGTIGSDLSATLKAARAELESALRGREELDAVLQEYQKLAEEAVKKDKKPSAIKMAWGAITAVVSALECLPSLSKLGQLLHLIPKETAAV
jgi:hypothetical protein